MPPETDLPALLTLKANWFDTLTVKQWEIMINNVLLFSATNELGTPYEQLLHYWNISQWDLEKLSIFLFQFPLASELSVNFDIRNWPIPLHLRGLGDTNLPRRCEELRWMCVFSIISHNEYCKKLLCGIVFFSVINKREAFMLWSNLSLVFM